MPMKIEHVKDAEDRLDKLFDEAFAVNDSPTLDWVCVKFALKEFYDQKAELDEAVKAAKAAKIELMEEIKMMAEILDGKYTLKDINKKIKELEDG